MKRPWTIKINSSDDAIIAIELPHSERTGLSFKELDSIANELEDLLLEHHRYKGYSVYVHEQPIDACPKCKEPYEPDWDEDVGEFCSNCGANKTDFMIKKLEESSERYKET